MVVFMSCLEMLLYMNTIYHVTDRVVLHCGVSAICKLMTVVNTSVAYSLLVCLSVSLSVHLSVCVVRCVGVCTVLCGT